MRGEERPSWLDTLRSVSRGTCLHPSSGRHAHAPPTPGPFHTSTTQNYAVSRETRSRASIRPVDERRMPPLIGPPEERPGGGSPYLTSVSPDHTRWRIWVAHPRDCLERTRVGKHGRESAGPMLLSSRVSGVVPPRQNVTRTVFPVEPHEFMMATAACSAEHTEPNVSSPRRTVRSFP